MKINKRLVGVIAIVATIAIPCFAGWYTCKHCNGSGYENWVKTCNYCGGKGLRETIEDCNRCSGQGKVRDQYGDWIKCSTCNGAKKNIVKQTCTGCNGTGDLKDPCGVCGGRGKVQIDD